MLTNTKFQFVTTEDSSLTARIGAPGLPKEECSEAMHSLRGAFSETVYIYGTAIERAFASIRPENAGAPEKVNARVLSMGLGLGYVELLSAALALRFDVPVRGESFEIVPELREYFLAWLSGGDLPPDFAQAYDAICARTASEVSSRMAAGRTMSYLTGGAGTSEANEHANNGDVNGNGNGKTQALSAAEVKRALAMAVADGAWLIREELTATTEFKGKFGCICFDAFSSKTTPDLWSEEFLGAFFQKTADVACVLSTYACTGALKRALKAEGFVITIREGFSSKRDSTFAVRN